jgi:hypothetical protein
MWSTILGQMCAMTSYRINLLILNKLAIAMIKFLCKTSFGFAIFFFKKKCDFKNNNFKMCDLKKLYLKM